MEIGFCSITSDGMVLNPLRHCFSLAIKYFVHTWREYKGAATGQESMKQLGVLWDQRAM